MFYLFSFRNNFSLQHLLRSCVFKRFYYESTFTHNYINKYEYEKFIIIFFNLFANEIIKY